MLTEWNPFNSGSASSPPLTQSACMAHNKSNSARHKGICLLLFSLRTRGWRLVRMLASSPAFEDFKLSFFQNSVQLLHAWFCSPSRHSRRVRRYCDVALGFCLLFFVVAPSRINTLVTLCGKKLLLLTCQIEQKEDEESTWCSINGADVIIVPHLSIPEGGLHLCSPFMDIIFFTWEWPSKNYYYFIFLNPNWNWSDWVPAQRTKCFVVCLV